MAVKKTTAARKPKAAAKAAPKKVETPVQAPVQSVVEAQAETVETAIETGSQAATATVEQAVAVTKTQAKKASKAAFANYGEFSTVNQENIDAMVKAGNVMAKGMESFSQELMNFAQASAEANVAATTRLFGVKSLQEAMDLQSAFARDSFDKAVAESNKLTEMSVKVASEAFEPLQDRMNVTVEKLLKPLAV